MTKYSRLIFVGLAVAALATAGPSRASAQCGDVNNDGIVDTNDIVCLSALVAAVTPPTACNPGPTCPGTDCDLFGDGLGPDNTDLAVLVDDFNGLETLHDPCASVGSAVVCGGPADPETGLPTLNLGGGGDVTISASQIWPDSCTIILEDSVFFETPGGGPTTVLTIEAGTVIKGEAGNSIPVVPALFILPGAKISAIGTPTDPIVFTSTAADGAKAKGDWGGVNINGRSIVNRSLVGPCLNEAEGVPVPYGGCIAEDSSGVAQFVRVEFAGLDFTANNELNLFTMNAVGSGTSFRFIQAHAGDDDCHEWFGGTINQDHLVASACGDDGFDSQLGFQGSLQFGLMVQNGLLTDSSPSRDSRGVEADNSEFDNNASPRTNARYCNLTLVGARAHVGENGGSDAGMLLRRGVSGTFANSIVAHFQDNGVELRDSATTDRACTVEDLVVRNTIFEANGTFPGSGTEHCKRGDCVNSSNVTAASVCTGAATPFACCTGAGTGCACNLNADCSGAAPHTFCHIPNGVCASCDWYNDMVATQDVANAIGSNACTTGLSDQYPGNNAPDYRPTFGGACPAAASCSAIDEAFVDTSYLGAIDPGAACTPGTSCDWLSTPWLNFETASNTYP
jgi:hypothetical protein